ncbi:MAG: DUF4129 domain-containing protein [Armatimonadota bacterium]
MRRVLRSLSYALPASAAAATVAMAAVRPSEQALRDALREILAHGYQLAPPARIQMEEWLSWLLRQLGRLLDALSLAAPLAGAPPWVTWVIFGICLALVLLILAHIVLVVRRVLLEPERRPWGGTRAARQREDPAAVLAQAEGALARGEYDLAVRLLYRAALLRLDRLGLLRLDATRTNWENLLALRAEDAGLHAALASLTQVVDDTVYGGEAVSSARAEACRGWVEAVWRAPAVAP